MNGALVGIVAGALFSRSASDFWPARSADGA